MNKIAEFKGGLKEKREQLLANIESYKRATDIAKAEIKDIDTALKALKSKGKAKDEK